MAKKSKSAASDDPLTTAASEPGTSRADIAVAPSTADEFIRDFANDSKWKLLRNVPIFDAHEEEYEVAELGPDDKPIKKKTVERFGAAELQEIADNCNRLVESGNPPGLTVGHTLDDAPETKQPETIGFGCNYRIAPVGPERKLMIVHDEKYFPDKYDLAKTMPYRSVERWRAGKYFKPIALLRREPRRNLGVVAAYSAAEHDTCIRYSMRYAMPDAIDADKVEIPTKPGSGPAAAAPAPELEPSEKDHQLYAKLCYAHPHLGKLIKYMEANPEWPSPKTQDYAVGDGSSNQVGQTRAMWHKDPEGLSEDPGHYRSGPRKMAADLPSGTNTMTPELDHDKLAADTLDLARYQADLHERDNRIAALERENRLERYHARLKEKHEQGYIFDVAEELTEMQDMSEAQASKHLKRIEKYERRAIGEAPIRLGDLTGPFNSPERISSKEEMENVLQYQADHPGSTKAQALQSVRSSPQQRSRIGIG